MSEEPELCLDCLRLECRCELDEAGDLEAQLDLLLEEADQEEDDG